MFVTYMAWSPKSIRGLLEGDPSLPLRLKLYQLMCLTTCVLCLLVILPSNALINLPWMINLVIVFFGVFSGACVFASWRGRHLVLPFFLVLLVVIDLVWFLNAGSEGSLTYYFFPALLYPMVMSRGWRRWSLAAVIIINACALLLIEHYRPGLVIPFANRVDRLQDLITGVYCAAFAILVICWFILRSYDREQERLSRYAAELEIGERRYREIFNASKDTIIILDSEGRILDVNARMCEQSGYARATALTMNITDFGVDAGPEARASARKIMDRALNAGPQSFEWFVRRHDGSSFWADVRLHATQLGGEQRLIAVARDITERKQALEALRLNEERLRLALEATSQGWFELNVQTGKGIASKEYVKLLGEDPATYQTDQKGWLDNLHPADKDRAIKHFQEAVSSGAAGIIEYRRRTKSGEWKWIRSTGRIVEYDEAGRPLLMRGTHSDVTERKQLELRLLHSQRLESIGTLSSGVAHDLNNILTPMLLACDLLKDRMTTPQDREQLGLLQREAKRGAAIVRQLLLFSRNIEGERVVLQPRHLINEMAQIMRETLPRQITVVDDVSADLWCVEADTTQLHQVLMNLCVNARDAMPGGGTLTLRGRNVPAAEVPLSPEGKLLAVPCVQLTVSDTGTGISPELIDRVFEPFFTTKGVGKGTGLGLSTVLGIAQSHSGFVAIQNQPGKGVAFQVYLPAKVDAMPRASSTPPFPTRSAPKSKETILVVDDEESVLLVTQKVLERAGYHILPANSGEEALVIFNQHATSIRLVVTDLMMPGIDGIELARRLRHFSPEIRILGASGISQDGRMKELSKLGFVEVMLKPYELATLVATVQRHVPPP